MVENHLFCQGYGSQKRVVYTESLEIVHNWRYFAESS